MSGLPQQFLGISHCSELPLPAKVLASVNSIALDIFEMYFQFAPAVWWQSGVKSNNHTQEPLFPA